MSTEYGEQYAYASIEEYEKLVGHTVNEAFRIGWDMARLKNGHLGITEPDKKEPNADHE